MPVLERGTRPPEKREGRAQLTVRDPNIEKLLAGLALEGDDLERMRQFGKFWWRLRNEHDIARRRGGLFSTGRYIDKADADRLLRLALADLQDGGGL